MLMLMSAILAFQVFAPVDQALAQAQDGSIFSASMISLKDFFIKMPFLLILGVIAVTLFFMVSNHHAKRKHHRFERFGNIWEIQEL